MKEKCMQFIDENDELFSKLLQSEKNDDLPQ